MDRSDRARFDNALAKFLYATNGTARPSPTINGTYWFVLKQFSWDDVAAGMTAAIKDSPGHVSPATLANLCRPAPPDVMAANENRAHDLEQRLLSADAQAERTGEKRFRDLWFNDEFRDVLRVANMDFGRRCNGGELPAGVRMPTADTFGYAGSFDYAAVVKAMLPPKGKTPNDASAAWECFWCVLAEEFQKHIDAL